MSAGGLRLGARTRSHGTVEGAPADPGYDDAMGRRWATASGWSAPRLLLMQGNHRINGSGTTGRNVAGNQRDDAEQGSDCEVGDRIRGSDAE